MSKSKKEQIPDNPFANFNLLKGEFIPPTNEEEVDDDVITSEPGEVLGEEVPEIEENLEAGTKLIEENIKKAEELAKKKQKTEVVAEEEEEESEDSEEEESSVYKALVQELYEKGISDFNHEDEDFEDKDEGVYKLLDKTLNNRWNKRYSKLPYDAKVFLDYVEKGGDPKEFVSIYYNENSWSDFKLDNDDAYKFVLMEKLKLDGEAQEDIDDMILEWELAGSLEKRAKPALSKMQKFEEAQKLDILKRQEEQTESAKKQEKEFWEGFKKNLLAKEDIKGFKVTPKIKDDLLNFMTQVDRKTGKTGYQLAMDNDPDASLLFALQAMNKFDIKKLEKQVETKAASKLAKVLQNVPTDSKGKISSGTTKRHVDENPFELFKKVKA